MNLLEAFKSGHPFRRIGEKSWRNPSPGYFYILSYSDILAEDWEVKQPREWNVVVDHDGALVDPARQIVSPEWNKIIVREVL